MRFISRVQKLNRSVEVVSRRLVKQMFPKSTVRFIKKFIERDHYTHHDNILLKKNKAIYFIIPKVACSSLKGRFAQELGLEIFSDKIDHDVHAINFPFVKKKHLDKFQNYFKFAFVRNPWDRIVSCYVNKIKLDKTINNISFQNGVGVIFLKYSKFWAGMTFEEFLLAINSIPDEEADKHFRSQYTFITDKKEKLFLDYLGRFENLEQNFLHVCKMIGIAEKELPKLMKSKRTSYKQYYNAKTRELVYQRYYKDIEIFRYQF